jgi:hypothetical protein
MPVANVGVVSVAVPQRAVRMGMDVRLAAVSGEVVLVSMVLVVPVRMRMRQRPVRVLVLVGFAQVQPEPEGHRRRCGPARPARQGRPQHERHDHAEQRRDRETLSGSPPSRLARGVPAPNGRAARAGRARRSDMRAS